MLADLQRRIAERLSLSMCRLNNLAGLIHVVTKCLTIRRESLAILLDRRVQFSERSLSTRADLLRVFSQSLQNSRRTTDSSLQVLSLLRRPHERVTKVRRSDRRRRNSASNNQTPRPTKHSHQARANSRQLRQRADSLASTGSHLSTRRNSRRRRLSLLRSSRLTRSHSDSRVRRSKTLISSSRSIRRTRIRSK